MGVTAIAKYVNSTYPFWNWKNDHWMGLEMEWACCGLIFTQGTMFHLLS